MPLLHKNITEIFQKYYVPQTNCANQLLQFTHNSAILYIVSRMAGLNVHEARHSFRDVES